MPVAISGFDALTCLGDAEETFAAICVGKVGAGPMRPDRGDPDRIGVGSAYQIADDPASPVEQSRRATAWLSRAVAAAAADAGLDATTRRVAAVVGTGLRELPTVERWSQGRAEIELHQLHFAAAIRAALPGVGEVLTLSNACSAGGHALAVAADLLDAGEADAVVVAGCDSMTQSMLSIIGRGSTELTEVVRPFDADRTGVLLGEGAAAVVLEPADDPAVRLRSVGLSCDAHHETALDLRGVARSMADAHERAGLGPDAVDLLIMHGTGTALNDPTEAAAVHQVFGEHAGAPLVTAIKGAIGHTSGGASLMSLIVAVQSLRAGLVPAVTGLSTPIPQADGLRLVVGESVPTTGRIAQVNAFGFGGVNAVAMVEVTG